MKKIIVVMVLFIFSPRLYAGETIEELIKSVCDSLVVPYVQPLATAFGTAIGSGLYRRAKTHKFLGFDLGLRIMYVSIPSASKTFDGKVLLFSVDPSDSSIDTSYIEVKDASTIFGPSSSTTILVGTDTIAIPPELPPGLNLPGLVFAVPQLSVGLFWGFEAMIRYIKFGFEGTDVDIVGLGLKNSMPLLKKLPCNISAQYWYQYFYLGDILSSTSWGVNLHLSKNLVLFAPYIGIGMENTSMHFEYEFEYDIPDSLDPLGIIPSTYSVDEHIEGENELRVVIGASFKLPFPFLFLNFDYNVGKYPSYTLGMGFSLR